MNMSTTLTPPVAEQRPHTFEIHGEVMSDEYAWLRRREDPDVIAYLEAENAYTEAMTADQAGLRQTLYEEMVGRIKQDDMSVPVQIDEYFYYSRIAEGQQYHVHCRRKGSMTAPEEVLLDLNRVAEELQAEYLGLGAFQTSPDHTRLAYSLDVNGSEYFTLRIRNLLTDEYYPEQITETTYGLVWGNDSRSFLYTLTDETHRANRIMRHRLGETVLEDREVAREDDPLFRIYPSHTTDRVYGIIGSVSSETNETHLLPLDDLVAPLQIVEPRRTGHTYSCDHREGTLYIVTNDNAPDFRLVTTPIDTPGLQTWEEMVPQRENVQIEHLDAFESFLAMRTREMGRTEVNIYRFETGEWERIPFTEDSYVLFPAHNYVYNTDRLRLLYSSMTTPTTTYDYEIGYETGMGELHLMKQMEILGGFDPSAYHTERTFATAEDGTKVPISLVYRTDLFKGDGSNPALLYAYGSYGHVVDPGFATTRISLLDRGFVYAIAHIRGGEDLGRRWYDEGKMKNKMNSFTDFIACGEHLVKEGYTIHEKLAIMGGSAGGLLMGAVINLAPALAKVAVAQVPFVDVINTMLDDTLPLTVGEYEEWGDPNDPEYFRTIRAYSPYDNVTEQAYPDLLVTAGLNDPRVQYWEPAKWVARLRRHTTGTGPILLKTNMGAGHGGPSGRYEHLKERAEEFAFVITRCEE